MKKLAILFMIVTISAMSLPGLAEPTVNKRQHHQKDRIHQGIVSGSLTKKEAASLIKQEKELNQKEKEYRSDGELTKKERYDLQTDLNQMNRHIYNQKHDGQSRD